MSTYDLRRFSNPDDLKKISPRRLLAFLDPHRKYFLDRGIALPPEENPDTLDYEGLANLFMTPDRSTPQGLADKLYFVHQMSTDEAADELLEELNRQGHSIPEPNPTAADIAIYAWLVDSEMLERKHAEQHLLRVRHFEHFQAMKEHPEPYKDPGANRMAALEKDLADWFESKKRARGVRVFVYPKADEVWFVVRHGELYKREGAIDGEKSEAIYYRPEKHDVLVYAFEIGELRIHACSPKEIQFYRTQFGLHLFGDENYFPGTSKYTLDPLKTDGGASLVCDDVSGLESVVLKEIRYYWPGPHPETEIRRGPDLFATLGAKQRHIPPTAKITRASLLMKLSGSKVPRTTTIQPSNIAQYTRDEDATIVEDFLRKRGFIKPRGSDPEDHAEAEETNMASV